MSDSEFDFEKWMQEAWGETLEIPFSLLANRKVSSRAKNLYVRVLCLSNPRKFREADLVDGQYTLKQVRYHLVNLRKFGYLPDEDAS